MACNRRARIALTVVALVAMTSVAFAHGGERHPTSTLPKIDVAVAFDRVTAKGDAVTGTLTLTVPEGWHLYAEGAPEEFVAASITSTDGVVDHWHAAWPKAGVVEFEGIKMPVYEGRVIVPLEGRLTVDPPATWHGVVTFQACGAELCLPPETREVTAGLE